MWRSSSLAIRWIYNKSLLNSVIERRNKTSPVHLCILPVRCTQTGRALGKSLAPQQRSISEHMFTNLPFRKRLEHYCERLSGGALLGSIYAGIVSNFSTILRWTRLGVDILAIIGYHPVLMAANSFLKKTPWKGLFFYPAYKPVFCICA